MGACTAGFYDDPQDANLRLIAKDGIAESHVPFARERA